MRSTSSLLAVLAFFAFAVLAVLQDDAYQVDFHYELLGLPNEDTTFFHQPSSSSKATLLYTLSDKGVLGAVNAGNGSIVWRQHLAPTNPPTNRFLRAAEKSELLISGVGNTVRAWDAWNGKLAWECAVQDERPIVDLEILEQASVEQALSSKDVLVLRGGKTASLARVNGDTGDIRWEYVDYSGDIPYQISSSATKVYYISLHTTILKGIQVKITELDPLSGEQVDYHTLSTEGDLSSAKDLLYVGGNTASPVIVWTDPSRRTLKTSIIGSRHVNNFEIPKSGEDVIEKITIHAPHQVNSLPHFLVHYQGKESHWAEVFHVNLNGPATLKAYSLSKLAGKGAFSLSNADANVYFTRITDTEVVLFSSASHGVLGRWPISGLTGPQVNEDVWPLHAASAVLPWKGSSFAVRSASLLSSGAWVLIENGVVKWQRNEALAGTVMAAFVDSHGQEELIQQLEVESHQTLVAAYNHRVRRHLRDLKYLPAWLRNFQVRIRGNFVGASTPTEQHSLDRDSYGFNKLILVATDTGRLIALNAGDQGKLAWNKKVANIVPGEHWNITQWKVGPTGTLSFQDDRLRQPIHVNVWTGQVSNNAVPETDTGSERSSSVLTYGLKDGQLQAWIQGKASKDPIWTFTAAIGERLVNFTTRSDSALVASIGRVLGDRRVLYKYLNPNLVLLTAVLDAFHTATFYLVNTVSGNVLYSSTHSAVDTSSPITAILSENWLAYSFSTVYTGGSSSQGNQLVIAEMYESAIPNDRGSLGAASNYSGHQPSPVNGYIAKPYVVSQTYQIPEEISHMAVTQTKQGITSRQLLVTLSDSNSIVAIPRDILNPRRPVERDPTTAELQEGLLRYSPFLDFDPKWYLNHRREVLGVEKVITSPALLESTSLVFAYGLDLFGTRVAPSGTFDMLGKSFNKLQMLATVAALALGVFIVAPMVGKRQTNTRWQLT